MRKLYAAPVSVLVAAVLGVLVFLLHLPATNDGILFDDSADYMRAAEASPLAIWLNTNSASPVQLMHLRGSSEQFERHPWDTLYVAGDNAALRHFHGPVSFYVMHAVHGWTSSDHAERLLASTVAAVTAAAFFLILLRLGVPAALALMLTLFASVQSRYVEVSADPTPHAWYILFALCFLFFFSRWLRTRTPRSLDLAVVCFSFAFATLEFTVQLIATVALVPLVRLLFDRGRLPTGKMAARTVVRAAAIFFVTTLVLWPGGWLRGGYLEDYGVLTAQMLFKNKAAFGAGEPLSVSLLYRVLFAHHAVLTILAALWILGALWLVVKRRLSDGGMVFTVYAMVAFLLGTGAHFRLSTYVSEFLIFMIAASGLVLADLFRVADLHGARLRGVSFALVLILVLGCVQEWSRRDEVWNFRPWLTPVFDGVRDQVPAGETIAVTDNREALSLYMPAYRFELTVNPGSTELRSALRRGAPRFFFVNDAVALPGGCRPVQVFATSAGHTHTLCRVE